MIQRILAALGLLFLIVTATPLVTWWTHALAGPWTDAKGDVLIVLGSDENQNMVGEFSYWRAVYAVHTWRQGGWKEMIISGGSGVAEAIRQFVICQGVPASAIRLESRSQSTFENAVFTAALLESDSRSKVLLTSDYHVLRAIRTFRKAGVDATGLPVPDASKRANAYRLRFAVFTELVKETSKAAYYAVRGWI